MSTLNIRYSKKRVTVIKEALVDLSCIYYPGTHVVTVDNFGVTFRHTYLEGIHIFYHKGKPCIDPYGSVACCPTGTKPTYDSLIGVLDAGITAEDVSLLATLAKEYPRTKVTYVLEGYRKGFVRCVGVSTC